MSHGQRFSAFNFGGKPCNVCGFQGGMLYVEVCKVCWGSLILCPKCMRIDCYGTKDEDYPRLAWWEKKKK